MSNTTHSRLRFYASVTFKFGLNHFVSIFTVLFFDKPIDLTTLLYSFSRLEHFIYTVKSLKMFGNIDYQ